MCDIFATRAKSQCTYRCVVLPDLIAFIVSLVLWESQCTYRCVVLPDRYTEGLRASSCRLNAPTGAWCSLTVIVISALILAVMVSMHLQVRGAP